MCAENLPETAAAGADPDVRDSMRSRSPLGSHGPKAAAAPAALLAIASALLVGCSTVGVGIGLPLPGVGSVGVSVDSGGNVGGGVSVGTRGVSVGVGGSGRLPPARAEGADDSASAPAGAASTPQN